MLTKQKNNAKQRLSEQLVVVVKESDKRVLNLIDRGRWTIGNDQ